MSISKILRGKSENELNIAIDNSVPIQLIDAIRNIANINLIKHIIQRNISDIINGEILISLLNHLKIAKTKISEEIRKLIIDILLYNTISQKYLLIAYTKVHNSEEEDIKEMILHHEKFDPGYNNNQLIRWAASEGETHLVIDLLTDKRVDPSDLDNAALKGALMFKHMDIINILNDERVKKKKEPMNENNINKILSPKNQDEIYKAAEQMDDPDKLLSIATSKLKNFNLTKLALEKGANVDKTNVAEIKDPATISLLLKYVNNISANTLIYKALKFGLEDDILELIKKYKIKNPNVRNIILIWSVGFAQVKLLRELLNNYDPNDIDFAALTEALSVSIARGNYLITDMLIKKGVDPSGDNNRPLRTAAEFNNIKAIELLIKDKRVIEKLSKDELKKYKNMAKIVKESLVEPKMAPAKPATKPGIKPGIKPGTKPGKPSPIRRERPSVTPKPKATAEEVVERYLKLVNRR